MQSAGSLLAAVLMLAKRIADWMKRLGAYGCKLKIKCSDKCVQGFSKKALFESAGEAYRRWAMAGHHFISHCAIICMVIVKRGSQWVLYTRDRKKVLGKFRTKKEALKRERQIIFFKYVKGKRH